VLLRDERVRVPGAIDAEATDRRARARARRRRMQCDLV